MKNLPGMHPLDCIIFEIALYFEGLNIDLDRKMYQYFDVEL